MVWNASSATPRQQKSPVKNATTCMEQFTRAALTFRSWLRLSKQQARATGKQGMIYGLQQKLCNICATLLE
jgi:ribosomal protein S14